MSQHESFIVKALFLSEMFSLPPIAAAAESYKCTTQNKCTMKNFGIGGWVSDVIIGGLDQESNVGAAFNYGIKEVHKTPIPIKFKKWSDSRFQFNWTLKGFNPAIAVAPPLAIRLRCGQKAGRLRWPGKFTALTMWSVAREPAR